MGFLQDNQDEGSEKDCEYDEAGWFLSVCRNPNSPLRLITGRNWL